MIHLETRILIIHQTNKMDKFLMINKEIQEINNLNIKIQIIKIINHQ